MSSSTSAVGMSRSSAHSPSVHTYDSQSAGELHSSPTSQNFSGAHTPPQSVSLSSWFWKLSSQLAKVHRLLAQRPLSQSGPVSQRRSPAHGAQSAPPQFTSVSSASRRSLVQWS